MGKATQKPFQPQTTVEHTDQASRTSEELRLASLARELESASLEDLKVYWRRHVGRSVPKNLSRTLFYRLLMYRLQAAAFGDLDAKTARLLDAIARGLNHANKDLRRTGPSPGSVLIREHDGVEHRVTVVQDGFAWNDRTFASLSQVAYAITGTKWSGPRFFGLDAAHA
jgi:hypothetical protein